MRYIIIIALGLTLAACEEGEPTGSTCPTDSALTYQNFGQQFFKDYCTGCHSAEITDRHGAPRKVNFDSEEEIRADAKDIDRWAAKGPKATNTEMPDLDGPVDTAPTDEERELLGQYLACMQP